MALNSQLNTSHIEIMLGAGGGVVSNQLTAHFIPPLQHLGNLPPLDGDYSEMICDHCMERTSFIQAYQPYSLPSQQICTIKKCDTNESIDIEGVQNESRNLSVHSVSSEVKCEGESSSDKEVCCYSVQE